ncbi:MAG: histidinol-phosphate transaminase [Bacillota bacterium]
MSRYRIMAHNARLKLDANEHPYGVAENLRGEMARRLAHVDPSRYPDDSCEGVRELLGEYLGTSPTQIIVGSGSNEVMVAIGAAFREDVDRVVIPRPTFGMYRVVATNLGIPVTEVATDDAFRLDPDELARSIRGNSALVFLCMPNNPTGEYFPDELIEAVLDAGPRALVIDEAYGEFGGRSYLNLVAKDPRVIVLRTLSKAFGLAGVRVGYCVAHPDVAGSIEGARAPYNVGIYSQVAAGVVLENRKEQLASVEPVLRSREKLFAGLDSVAGIAPHPSDASFILFRVEREEYGMSAEELWRALLGEGISIRRFEGSPELDDYLRVSVGLPRENEEFLENVERLGARDNARL